MSAAATKKLYARVAPESRVRIVLLMPEGEVKAIDDWALPAGMRSRSAAIRFLVKEGIAAARRTG